MNDDIFLSDFDRMFKVGGTVDDRMLALSTTLSGEATEMPVADASPAGDLVIATAASEAVAVGPDVGLELAQIVTTVSVSDEGLRRFGGVGGDDEDGLTLVGRTPPDTDDSDDVTLTGGTPAPDTDDEPAGGDGPDTLVPTTFDGQPRSGDADSDDTDPTPAIGDYWPFGTQYTDIVSMDDSGLSGAASEFPPSEAPTVAWTYDQIATQLTHGYWIAQGGTGNYHYNVAPGGTITYNTNGLTAAGVTLAQTAFQAWSMVTGINFVQTAGAANITLDDNTANSAFANFSTSGGFITSSTVNVGTGWLSTYGTTLNSYSFQTYIHEIGHALGLGHAGNYNGSATYSTDALYLNDSWQATVMSYFDQTDNTYVDASFAWVVTPQMADIIAMQNLYGIAGNLRTGNTTYGNNSTAGGYYNQIFGLTGPVTWTIIDDGGIDTLDFSPITSAQRIDLTPGSISNVEGYTGNLIIYRTTVIENAIGGNGNDVLVGNSADNVLTGNGGVDELYGGLGYDHASYSSATGPVMVNLAAQHAWDGAAMDFFNSIEGAIGSNFNDNLYGGQGLTFLQGRGGNDGLFGYGYSALGFYFTVASYDYATTGVVVDLASQNSWDGAAMDFFVAINGAGGSAFNDILIGNNADNFFQGGAGVDSLQGGGGSDWAAYMNATTGVKVDLAAQNAWDGAAMDFYSSIENVVGSAFGDILTGSSGNNTLEGGGGVDAINGGGGHDLVSFYFTATSGVKIDLAAQNTWDGTSMDFLASIEGAIGSNFDDLFFGDNSDNTFEGAGGVDTINGGGGGDTVTYNLSTAAVTVNLQNQHAWDGSSMDFFNSIENASGSVFNDIITGSTGNNVLAGGGGDDQLTGGGGSDRFVFGPGGGNDSIFDFDASGGAGQDYIDVTGYGYTAGQLGTAITITQVSTPGGPATIIDFGDDTLVLNGVTAASITAADFIFAV